MNIELDNLQELSTGACSPPCSMRSKWIDMMSAVGVFFLLLPCLQLRKKKKKVEENFSTKEKKKNSSTITTLEGGVILARRKAKPNFTISSTVLTYVNALGRPHDGAHRLLQVIGALFAICDGRQSIRKEVTFLA